MYVERSPTPPQIRANACTVFRLVADASFGNPNATTKQTIEYTAKQMPPHSLPSAKRVELASVAPKMCREVIKPKNIHKQRRPSQVNIGTPASFFIVCGISLIAEIISESPAVKPVFSARFFLKASISSGGYSFDVSTVQITHNKNAAAPILNEYCTVSGIPLAVLPVTPPFLKR